jgi:hypothetical protein
MITAGTEASAVCPIAVEVYLPRSAARSEGQADLYHCGSRTVSSVPESSIGADKRSLGNAILRSDGSGSGLSDWFDGRH